MPAYCVGLIIALLIACATIAWLARRRRSGGVSEAGFDRFTVKFLENAFYPCIILDKDGKIVRTNAEADAFFHLGVDAVGKPMADYLPDAVVPLFLYSFLEKANDQPLFFVAETDDSTGGGRRFKGMAVLPLPGPGNNGDGCLLTVGDLTDAEGPQSLRKRMVGGSETRFVKSSGKAESDREEMAVHVLLDESALAKSIGPPSQVFRRGKESVKKEVPAVNESDAPKALLVEDNGLIRKVASSIIAEAGYAVELAENGAVAVEKCRDNRYDIVFMDIHMPVMNGDEAARKIRELPDPAGKVYIVAVTASDNEIDREKADGAGMDGYLVKPFNLDQFKEAKKRSFK